MTGGLKCWKKLKTCSSCAKFQLIQFKIVHRAHHSNSRPAKIYANTSDSCDRCSQTLGEYLKSYFRVISEITEPSPDIAMFGIPQAGKNTSLQQAIYNLIYLSSSPRILLILKKPPHLPRGCVAQCLFWTDLPYGVQPTNFIDIVNP